jgi:CheY-like chemotaxis protein
MAADEIPSPMRILLIEDNAERIGCFREWLPEDAHLVVAAGAGRALGILHRCRPDFRDRRRRSLDYAGILLDHDLVERVVAAGEEEFSGTHVAGAIIERISVEVPILIHSMNFGRATAMQPRLERAGFWTTRIPMSLLTRDRFLGWLDQVRENWVDLRDR